MQGLITKSIGGLYTVEASEGIYECKARGVFRKRNISPVCGDRVEFSLETDGTGVIDSIGERSSLLIRPPLANLDLLVFVSSTCEPRPNMLLLDKFIAIAEYKRIKPVVVFTKIDKEDPAEFIEIYDKAGITALSVDNTTGRGSEEVKALITGKLSAFTGNTGVGKSSLMKHIFPDRDFETGEISRKLGRGRHTTRHIELFKLEGGGYVADTPGFSSFDTNRYDIIFKDELAACFIEFAKYEGKCRFADCRHIAEKGCVVIEAVSNGEIAPSRHESYVKMYEEASLIKEWEHKNER
ncbi:MAG: ribosome small subunit-dependent GTPase A [Ruminococcus sp.]|nr:ribosome small subunit-dependent GTPase A [Ruminococcus sp.]